MISKTGTIFAALLLAFTLNAAECGTCQECSHGKTEKKAVVKTEQCTDCKDCSKENKAACKGDCKDCSKESKAACKGDCKDCSKESNTACKGDCKDCSKESNTACKGDCKDCGKESKAACKCEDSKKHNESCSCKKCRTKQENSVKDQLFNSFSPLTQTLLDKKYDVNCDGQLSGSETKALNKYLHWMKLASDLDCNGSLDKKEKEHLIQSVKKHFGLRTSDTVIKAKDKACNDCSSCKSGCSN